MPVIIQTNLASLQAQKNISSAQSMLSTSFNRLSSGYRINSAKDDAAGLAISESMKMQVRSYTVVERNANDAISMSQTADGSLGEVSSILGRMRELAAQGSNGSLQTSDRSYLETEFLSLQAEITRIITSTKFNGIQLINSAETSVAFQVGINNVSTDRITLTFGGVDMADLVDPSTTTLSGDTEASQSALDVIDAALQVVNTARARFGAVMNRMDVAIANIETMRLNVQSANSRIRDVDVAEETSAMSRTQVLLQAGSAVLAQANQLPQQALSLLRQ